MQQIMEPNPALMDQLSEIADEFHKNLTLASSTDEREEEVEDEDEDEDEDDFEFTFIGEDLKSPVSAEEVFQNGQIRPLFTFSDEQAAGNSEEATTSYGSPVRKVFVVSSSSENDDVAEGPYCVWSGKSPATTPAPAPEMSRKSNSTGLSKLWKVRDLLVRSHSDGKDAFVFLTGKNDDEKVETASFLKEEGKREKVKVNTPKIKVERSETAAYKGNKGKQSAYEVFYNGKKKEKKGGKSYLPYRQDLVGFFTNVNGMSRNIHPY